MHVKMSRRMGLHLALTGIATLTVLSSLSAQSLTWLGVFPGADSSVAYGVSADGQTVVGVVINSATSIDTAFLWTPSTGMVSLGTLGGRHSYAYDVSADGSVVVGSAYNASNSVRAFRWSSGSMQDLGVPPGARWSIGSGVSADGNVVVGQFSLGAGRLRPYRWTASTGMEELPLLEGATLGEATAASADGTVIVGYVGSQTDTRAVRWTANGVEDISKRFHQPCVRCPCGRTNRSRSICGCQSTVCLSLDTHRRVRVLRYDQRRHLFGRVWSLCRRVCYCGTSDHKNQRPCGCSLA